MPLVKTGALKLTENGFYPLTGQRVGLITNHTARVGKSHLINLIANAPNVELVTLFGPEHGIHGSVDDAVPIADSFDEEIGVPIYSLYGQHLKPLPETLSKLDVLVFDIQDIGARFYTYISTMGLAMQAASKANLPFIILDRPNPLGGMRVSGYVLEPSHASFEGQYPIPIQHGLTIGELALMIKGEKFLRGLEQLELEVITMDHWQRDLLWPDTGLDWVKTSSNIPTFEIALIYPGACFFEATAASEGRGTHTPFKLIGAPWANGQSLADTLNARNLPGIRFESATFTPRPIKGMDSNPKLEGQTLSGIQHIITDAQTFLPVDTGIHVIHAFYRQSKHEHIHPFVDREAWMTRLAGTSRFLDLLHDGASPSDIIASWQDEIAFFQQKRAPYLLY